ncbi:uncharacterized protein LOC130815560 [Amaranthus tricolor]|uniref:uncharacterized protein LOC130815560 n=1 Tax=Amaranthus tricolor TaxID=29722 RepID=UPI00258D98EA|nr:uncharacterized protein LOC130815560 [Amaranthus tricolor]
MGEWFGNSWVWNLQWRRLLYDWEIEDLRGLEHMIQLNEPKRDTEDGVLWHSTEVASYPTKCIYAKFNDSPGSSLPNSIAPIIWKNFIPPRAKLTIWLANQEKLKTGDFLVEKGIITQQNAWCPFCRNEIESNSHILFVCRFAWSAWMEVLKWWGLSAPLHMQFSKFSIQWLGLADGRRHRHFWALMFGCIIWSLWYERNLIKFERKIPNLQNFVSSLRIRIGIWAKEMMGSFGCAPNAIYNADSFIMYS